MGDFKRKTTVTEDTILEINMTEAELRRVVIAGLEDNGVLESDGWDSIELDLYDHSAILTCKKRITQEV